MRKLIFLPGVGADPGFWQPLGKRLPADWNKVYLGWPGLGHQPPSPQVRCYDDLVAMVVAELGDERVDVLAQSMGGAIALQVALNYPSRVRRLVLAVTAGGLDVASLGASDWRPAYRLEYPEAASWVYDMRPDLAGEFGNIHQPTLLLWGDNDPISPLAVGEYLNNALPCAALEIVRGGDHGLINSRSDAVAPAILRHLA